MTSHRPAPRAIEIPTTPCTPTQPRGRWNLAEANLLASSRGRGWRGVAAELRRHTPGEAPDVTSDRMVVGIALAGSRDAVIHRTGDGQRQATQALTGTIWLCPQGVPERDIRITGAIPEMLHVYLPDDTFSALSRGDGMPAVSGTAIRYDSGFQDALIAGAAAAIARELGAESSAGRLRTEAAALTIGACLVHRHGTVALPHAARLAPGALDERRLRRVTEYVEAHAEAEVSLAALAEVAKLSPFHFLRAFRAATGRTPQRFVSEWRLERAKALLAAGDRPLVEIAHRLCFASQASFTRAFSRATGLSPGAFRRLVAPPAA